MDFTHKSMLETSAEQYTCHRSWALQLGPYLRPGMHNNGFVLVHSIVQHNLLALNALQLCQKLSQLLALQGALRCTAGFPVSGCT